MSCSQKARILFGVVFFSTVLLGLAAGPENLPDFDHRYDKIRGPVALAGERQAAHKALTERVPDAQVKIDPLLGNPSWIISPRGKLSGPHGQGKAISAESARAFDPKDPDLPIKAMLQEHRKLYGHGAEVLATGRKSRDYISADDGARIVFWDQQLDGIPVYRAKLGAQISAKGELLRISSTFVPDVAGAATAGVPRRKVLQRTPDVSARKALSAAIQSVKEEIADAAIVTLPSEAGDWEGAKMQKFKAGQLPGDAQASLIWLPMSRDRMRLCWNVEVTRREGGERFRVMVDAENGEVILRQRLTLDISDASYLVYTGESPSPLSPTWSTPSKAQPDFVPQQLVTLSALDRDASPLGWLPDGANDTRGNNVEAYLDRDADNLPDLPRVQGNSFRVFNYTNDLTQSPTNYGAAAVVNVFYWCNWIHDRLFQIGFTPTNGNFQKDKFGIGKGGDPVLVECQDGSGFNNANFSPAPEGYSPRLQFYIFNGPKPWRDSALDASVVLHEYAHGMSDRLVGGGGGLNTGFQPYGLAEGWSDFVAQALLSKAEDDPDGIYACGGYTTYMFNLLQENYYFGIRRYPYTTQTNKNPLCLRHIFHSDVPEFPNIPRNPTITSPPVESHRMGEVWCTILWEMRANLVRKWGYERGNDMALRLVRRGMENTPENPTFVNARDGIIAADMDLYGGANQAALWAAFAKRGLGVGAEAWEVAWMDIGVKESYRVPPPLEVHFPGSFSPVVQLELPFSAESATCTLRNNGQAKLSWHAETNDDWLSIVPPQGELSAQNATNVILMLNTNILAKAEGAYTNRVVFVDQSSDQRFTNEVLVRVISIRSAWNIGYYQNSAPRDYFMYTFVPDSNQYTVCRQPATWFPTDPAGGVAVQLLDDSYWLITLTNGADVSIMGVHTNKLLIGSNGDIATAPPPGYVNTGTNDFYPGDFFHAGLPYDGFFEVIRAGVLYTDLNPAANSSNRISWKQLPDRVAISYERVPEFGNNLNVNSFQIELFFNGIIRLTYCGINSTAGVGVGFSPGYVGANLVVTDLSSSPSCGAQLMLPSPVVEGQGNVNGRLHLLEPGTEGEVLYFSSSDTNIAVVVPSVTLLQGQTEVPFVISLPDDGLLKGPQMVTITVRRTNYEPISAEMEVWDNETATMTLALPTTVTEGAGRLPGAGRVSFDRAPDGPIQVTLVSSTTQLLQVPAWITIPAGQSSATFDLFVMDNEQYDTTRVVSVQAVITNWPSVMQNVSVLDDEVRQVEVLLPARFLQTSGLHRNAGYVQIMGTLETNLVVALSSDNTNILQVPDTVTIPAGVKGAYFDVMIVDGGQNNDVVVSVTAGTEGFLSGSIFSAVGGIAVPSAPSSPSPADGATKQSWNALVLNWGTLEAEWPGTIAFEVYFGTNPVPGEAEFQGRTSDTNWPVSHLTFGTTYYWQIVATRGTNRVAGPVWRFTTMGLSHFEISSVASPQALGDNVSVIITAKDENFQTATNFTGPAKLKGLAPTVADSIVITEVATAPVAQVEFANVSDHDIDITGWQITLYDWVSWPNPRTTYTIPGRVMCAVNDVFVLWRSPVANYPGVYPLFTLGGVVGWNITGVENPVAVLLRDNAGKVVDFMCGMDADPTQITNPIAIPRDQWIGSPALPNLAFNFSMQRMGGADHNRASDWIVTSTNVGELNPNLVRPFLAQREVEVVPGTLTNFVNGVWSGEVKVLEVAPEVMIQVDDGQGHFGTNEPFAVTTGDDLTLAVQQPASMPWLNGTSFDYVLTVSNSGPATATGVWLRDKLPMGADLDSVTPSQGTYSTNADGTVLCNLGTLAAASSCSVRIAVRPSVVGSLTNFAETWCAEGEKYLENNSVETVTRVDSPWLSIGNLMGYEGNTTNVFLFPVTVSGQGALPVTVNYYTADGTGKAGVDYVPTSGTLVFTPPETNANIPVKVLGNTLVQNNRTFFVHLSDPTNAVVGNSPAKGTILDDDIFLDGLVSAWDATVVEGDDGVTDAVFRITLSRPEPMAISVYYETRDGTATAGLDYVPTWGKLVFQPGETNKTISVGVLGDRLVESNETFSLTLTFVDYLYIARQGVGTIVDDDSALVTGFTWNLPDTNQWINAPFYASLYAIDGAGRVATSYNGPVDLRAGRKSQQVTIGAGTNLAEYPFGTAYQDSRLQVIYSPTEIGRAGRITALALRLATLPGQSLNGWTIRMKMMPTAGIQPVSSWESFQTAPVFQGDVSLASGGWVTFPLQNPFNYDGAHALMIDFSFNNSSSSGNGFCYITSNTVQRALGLRTDSYYGDPLSWVGALAPPSQKFYFYPNIRLNMDREVGIGPAAFNGQSLASTFLRQLTLTNGVWSGMLSLEEIGPDVFLLAQDSQGLTGKSGLLHVMGLKLERVPEGVRISFLANAGERYQIESTDQLVPMDWVPLTGVIEGQGDVYTVNDSIGEGTSRFYRVKVVQ